MAEYYVILTSLGQAALAAAQAGGEAVHLTEFAVGDGGGAYCDPLETQVGLVNEVWRGSINKIFVHSQNHNWVVAEALIPADEGGFDIREAGIFDDVGNLFAVGKYPLTTKPAYGSGSEKELYVRLVMQVSNAADVQMTVDLSVATATMQDLADHEAKQLDPADTDEIKEKHLSNAQANGWEAAIAANAQVISDEISNRAAADTAHAGNTGNPHNVTKAQVGLGSVPNTDFTSAVGANAAAIAALIPSGSVMIFGQNAAPTGWTRKTDWQDNTMLCYAASGNIGSGGSVNPQSAHMHTGPIHAHTGSLHTHSGPLHTHGPGSLRWESARWQYSADPGLHLYDPAGALVRVMPAVTAFGAGGITGISWLTSDQIGYTANGTGATSSGGGDSTGPAGAGNTGYAGDGATGLNTAPHYQEVIAAIKD